MPVTVSVVVVNWNGASIIRDCLASLVAQDVSDFELELIVVDNGSRDGSREIIEAQFPAIRVIALPENLGFAAGANVGIATSVGEYVLLINNDARADPGLVQALLDSASGDATVGAVTGMILLEGRFVPASPGAADALVGHNGEQWIRADAGVELVNSTGGELTTSANGRDRDWLVPASMLARAAGPVAAFSGGAVLLSRAALDEVGNFDEELFMYYEDSDLSWRMRRTGWRIVFEPAGRVRHLHAASSGTATEFFLFHNERNRVLFAIKHGTARVIACAFGRTIASLLRAALVGDGDGTKRKFRAIAASLRMARSFATKRRAIDRAAMVGRSQLWADAPSG